MLGSYCVAYSPAHVLCVRMLDYVSDSSNLTACLSKKTDYTFHEEQRHIQDTMGFEAQKTFP